MIELKKGLKPLKCVGYSLPRPKGRGYKSKKNNGIYPNALLSIKILTLIGRFSRLLTYTTWVYVTHVYHREPEILHLRLLSLSIPK